MSINVPRYEELLEDCLDRVSDELDKREGSVIYDAISPAMWEMRTGYETVSMYHDNTYPGTASRSGLIDIAEEIGISPHPATKSIVKGVFTPASKELQIGTRFNREDLNFSIIEKQAPGIYFLECDKTGAVGNTTPGLMTPVDNISGLETAELKEILVYGEDEEDTEEFRERYFETIRNQARDGNVAQYMLWASEFPGIGGHKVKSCWNGRNTVKVYILDTMNGVASDKLVSDFQDYLDPPKDTIKDDSSLADYPQGRGLGNGKAPIGAIVTVVTGRELMLNISADITLSAGYTSTDEIDKAVSDYLAELRFKKQIVSYLGVGSAIQMCKAVEMATNLKINGGTTDIIVGDEEVAALGETEWTVA